MSNLQRLKELLNENRKTIDNTSYSFRIPKVWNATKYKDYKDYDATQIQVNPTDFFIHCIDFCQINKRQLPTTNNIYSLMIRTQTAYDHYSQGQVQQGTYIKAIAMIPYLQSIGIDTIYLLPIFSYSDNNKKGSIGSVYAVKDFYSLEKRDYDDLTGEYSKGKLDLQFAAFVEACHCAKMKVIVDFVFRTCSRDNILVKSHPDWFYWIYKDIEGEFGPPKIDSLGELAQPIIQNTRQVYTQEGIQNYINKFSQSPKFALEFVEKLEQQHLQGDFLPTIENEYKITTAPAFSDCINDFQPNWSDITYLRLDMGISIFAKQFGFERSAPYVLPDVIKLSNHPIQKPNEELWEYLSGIIPYYITKFDIDGARIDMGHALPKQLLATIQKGAKAAKQNFFLWSEELHTINAHEAKRDGANIITGAIWNDFLRFDDSFFNSWFLKELIRSELPCASALELADTPRAEAQWKNLATRKDLFVFSCCLPNVNVVINSGFELCETQPMNLGLGKSERNTLDENDPMSNKLAFFDIYKLHWQNEQSSQMIEFIKQTLDFRKEFIEILTDKKCFEMLINPDVDEYLTAFLFYNFENNNKNKKLLIVFNRNKKYARRINLEELTQKFTTQKHDFYTCYLNGKYEKVACLAKKHIQIEPASLTIFEII